MERKRLMTTTDPEYRIELEDWGLLEEWLAGLEAGAEDALLDSDDDVLLRVLGVLDRLAVGDLVTMPEGLRDELTDRLALIQATTGSEAHLDGFRSVNVAGMIDGPVRERLDALRDRIRAELQQRGKAAG